MLHITLIRLIIGISITKVKKKKIKKRNQPHILSFLWRLIFYSGGKSSQLHCCQRASYRSSEIELAYIGGSVLSVKTRGPVGISSEIKLDCVNRTLILFINEISFHRIFNDFLLLLYFNLRFCYV